MIRSVSPIDGLVYAEVDHTSPEAARAAFAAAREAQAAWAAQSVADRAAICSAAVDAMLALEAEIVPELAWMMGRPVSQGAGELRGFEERARYMIGIAEEALAPVRPDPKEGFERWVARAPLGVIFVLAPWNFPYLTVVNSVIPALMAGNAVVLKHADQTVLAGGRFAQAFAVAGLPDGLFQHLVIDHDLTAVLIAEGLADQVAFTGSVAGGQAVERSAAGTFTGVGLELGGKDAAYVLPDADVEKTADALLDGGFFNAGQSCCAIERVYAHRDVYDALIEAMVAIARRDYRLGNPLEQNTNLGPMVRAGSAAFVRGQIEDAVGQGARALLDPSEWAANAPGTPYLAPQILTGVDHSMDVMQSESFGPVLGVMPVAGDAEAVALMNDSPFGLTASVWGQDIDRARSVCDRAEAGTVFVNRCDYLDPALAWTGVKHSGRGATLSKIGYETLTRPKSYHIRSAF